MMTVLFPIYRSRSALCGGLCLALLLCSAGCRQEKEPVAMRTGEIPPPVLAVSSHRDLDRFFATQNYTVQTLGRGVPPFIVEHIPDDLLAVEEPEEKKRLFFLSLLPMVLLANDEIAAQRRELQRTFARFDSGKPLEDEELDRLSIIAADYLVDGDPLREPRLRQKLLERVDVIPPPLILAQAATESGYGTSRYARLGNNLFGMYTFDQGTGIVPRGRPQGRSHEIRRFPSVYDSLRFYLYTLNTHDAYSLLRRRRALHRALGEEITRVDLTDTLGAYSERGDAYIRDLRIMIRSNRLSLFTDASLRPPPPQRPVPPLRVQVESTAN